MSQSDVVKLFKEVGALTKETAVGRKQLKKHLGVDKLPTSIEHPLGRMIKAGEITVFKKEVLCEGRRKGTRLIQHYYLNLRPEAICTVLVR